MPHVVKRSGRRGSEVFDQNKLHASLQAACLSVRSPEGFADQTAHSVTQIVCDWVEARPSVTSNDIRRVAAKTLEVFHPEAAYLYQTHEMVI